MIGEHAPVVAVPGALEPFVWIVLMLQLQELDDPRMSRFDLAAGSPAVVRQVVTAAVRDRATNQAAKRRGGRGETGFVCEPCAG